MDVRSLTRSAILGVILLNLLATIPGCESKVDECKRLIDTVNATKAKLEAVPAPGKDLAKVGTSAETYAAVAEQGKRDVGALRFKDANLDAFVKDYVNVLTIAAKTAHDVAALAKPVVKETKDVAKEHKAQLAAINALKKQCAKPSADCIAVGKILAKTPPPHDYKKLLAMLEEQHAALDRLKPRDKNLARTVAAYSSNVEASARTLAAFIADQDRFAKVTKDRNETAKKEYALVDGINRYCHK